MEAYIWLILASMLAVGILIGYFMGRSKGDTSAPKVQELEDGIAQATQEMQDYRGQVTNHFEKTANLFNQLTNDYREVYEHLANSSEKLCGDQVAKLKGLTAETKVLQAEGEKVVSQATEAVNDTKATEAEKEKSEPAASAAESVRAEPAAKAEVTTPESGSVDEKISAEPETKDASDSDATPAAETIDKKADETRSTH